MAFRPGSPRQGFLRQGFLRQGFPLQSSLPRPRYLLIALASFSTSLAAFLLFLLVGLSSPILQSIYILAIVSSGLDSATSLVFGVWGVCVQGTLDSNLCYGPHLGYSIPSGILDTVGLSPTAASFAQRALLAVLILHLVVALLAAIVLLFSLFLYWRTAAGIATFVAVVTGLISTLVFVVDVVLVVLVRQRIDSVDPGMPFSIEFGNAVWMTCAGMVLMWITVVLLSARSCYCLGVRRPVPEEPFMRESQAYPVYRRHDLPE